MFIGTLPPAANKADWVVNYELTDDETGDLIDLSGVDQITIEICSNGAPVLSGSKTGGEITITDTGVFTWSFTADQMHALCAKTYDVGCTLTKGGETLQLIIGRLPVLDGIVT